MKGKKKVKNVIKKGNGINGERNEMRKEKREGEFREMKRERREEEEIESKKVKKKEI